MVKRKNVAWYSQRAARKTISRTLYGVDSPPSERSCHFWKLLTLYRLLRQSDLYCSTLYKRKYWALGMPLLSHGLLPDTDMVSSTTWKVARYLQPFRANRHAYQLNSLHSETKHNCSLTNPSWRLVWTSMRMCKLVCVLQEGATSILPDLNAYRQNLLLASI